MSTFEAKYGGICPECGNRIEAGDEVVFDGTHAVIHADCSGVNFDWLDKPTKACQECFLIPCAC